MSNTKSNPKKVVTKTKTKIPKLKYILLEKGITQVELVEIINKNSKKNKIGHDNISRIVNGKKDMYVSTLLKICKALDVTPNDILGFDTGNFSIQ